MLRPEEAAEEQVWIHLETARVALERAKSVCTTEGRPTRYQQLAESLCSMVAHASEPLGKVVLARIERMGPPPFIVDRLGDLFADNVSQGIWEEASRRIREALEQRAAPGPPWGSPRWPESLLPITRHRGTDIP